MSSMIDTLAISKRLQRAGDTPEHADAVAEVFGMLLQENVVRKVDLRDACNRLDEKVDTVAATLDKKIDTVAATLDKKIDTVAETLDKKIDTIAATLDKKIDMVAATLDKKIDMVAVNLGSDIRGLSERGDSLAARYEGRLSRAMLTLFVGLTGVITLATSLLMAHSH